MDGWLDGWIDGWIERKMDTWIDKTMCQNISNWGHRYRVYKCSCISSCTFLKRFEIFYMKRKNKNMTVTLLLSSLGKLRHRKVSTYRVGSRNISCFISLDR
jgi:hypothetical protein